MAKFYYQPHKNLVDQWNEHIQQNYYIDDIKKAINAEKIIIQNNNEYKQTDLNVLREIFKSDELLHQIQNTNLELNNINKTLQGGFAMIDWQLDQLNNEQRITNVLIQNLIDISKMPDFQKRRLYYLEEGLRYYKSFISNIENKDDYFSEIKKSFIEVTKIKEKDVIANHILGKLHMYFPQELDLKKSKKHFKISLFELNSEIINKSIVFNDTLKSNNLTTDEIKVDLIRNLSRIDYLEGNARKAYERLFKLINYENFDQLYIFDTNIILLYNVIFEYIKYVCASNDNVDDLFKYCEDFLSLHPDKHILKLTGDKDINSNIKLMVSLEKFLKRKHVKAIPKAKILIEKLSDYYSPFANQIAYLEDYIESTSTISGYYLEYLMNTKKNKINFYDRKEYTGTLEEIYNQILKEFGEWGRK